MSIPFTFANQTGPIPLSELDANFTYVLANAGGGGQGYSIVDYGADPAGVLDSTAAIQECINDALTNKVPVYIPSGTYKTTSTITINSGNNPFYIFGDGGTSIIAPTSFAAPVITILPGNNWQNEILLMENFNITAASVTTGQWGIYSNSTNGTSGVQMNNIQINYCDVGFYLLGNQFCTYSTISASYGNVGLYFTQDPTQGGGNSSTFDSCWFRNNVVGIMFIGLGTYPMGIDRFINCVTNNNSVAAFYLNKAQNVSIESWAPEANGSGAASFTYNGYTVTNSIFQATTSSMVAIKNYQNVSNTQKFYIQNSSVVSIDSGSVGTFIPNCDSTSLLTFADCPSIFRDVTSQTSGVLGAAPRWFPGGNAFSLFVSPMLTEAAWLTNDAINATNALGGTVGSAVEWGYASGGTNATYAYVTDSQMGYVNQFSFSSTGSAGQAVMNTASASYTGIGTYVVTSFLVKTSSSSAVYNVGFAQDTVNTNFSLPANTWVRIILVGQLQLATRGAYCIFTAYDSSAVGQTLKICKIHSMTAPNVADLSNFVRNGLYNPGQFKTRLYQLSAAPTVGTWAVGSLVYNSAPTAGGYVGWVCTTAGTPGTWKTFGAISA